jgi:PAS domain S-box-containing protein
MRSLSKDASAFAAVGSSLSRASLARGSHFRLRFLLPVVVAAVPLLALAMASVWQIYLSERDRAEGQILSAARSLSSLIDARFMQYEALLRGLATRGANDDAGGIDRLRARLSELELEPGTWVTLYDDEGRLLTMIDDAIADRHLRVRPPPAISVNAPQIRRVATTGKSEVSRLFTSGVQTHGLTINVAVPAERNGTDRHVLAIGIVPQKLEATFDAHLMPDSWIKGILDPHNVIVARSNPRGSFVGQPTVAPLSEALKTRSEGLLRDVMTLEGIASVVSFARAPNSLYVAAVAVPEAEFQQPLRRAVAQTLGLGALFTALAFFLALTSSRRTTTAIQNLARLAGAGSTGPVPQDSGIVEIDAIAQQLVVARQERAAAEDLLRLSEAKAVARSRQLEALYDNAPIGIATFDSNMRFTSINNYLAAMNRRSIEEHIGSKLFDVLPHVRDQLAPVIEGVLHRGETFPHVEITHNGPDGTSESQYFIVRYFPIRHPDGTVAAAGVVVDNVTAQRRAEEALKTNEQRLRFLVQAIPGIVWTSGPDGSLSYISPRWEEITGRESATTEDIISVIHPDDRDRTMQAWDTALGERAPYTVEHRLLCKDGVHRWFLSNARPQFDDGGRIVKWFGVATMIDEQKRIEHALQEALAERELLIREVDHRVRNSLSIVQSLLRMQANAASDETVRAQLLNATQRINSISRVHERLHAGKSVSHVVADEFIFAIGEDLEGVLGVEAQGRTLKMDVEPVVLEVQQAVAIGLVLTELVTNAMKYGRGTIDVTLKVTDEHLRLVVCDDGDGPPEDFRLDGTQGSLGMRIATAMARQLNGAFKITRDDKVCFVLEAPYRL